MDNCIPLTQIISYETYSKENCNIQGNSYNLYNENIMENSHEDNVINKITTHENDNLNNSTNARPKKGRKRKFPEQNRMQKKKKLNTGQEYINHKGKVVEKKEFKGENFDCKCPKKCAEKLTVEQRRAEFNKFWTAGSYETRCALLQGCVKQKNKKRCYSDTSRRQFTREYTICDVPVCKKMLTNTFSISQSRVDVALAKFSAHMPLNDQRGVKSGGKNKIPDSEIEKMRDFFEKLPKSGGKSSYISGDLNLTILFNMFTEKYPNSCSRSRFKKYFYEECNLRFKKTPSSNKASKGSKINQFMSVLNLFGNEANVTKNNLIDNTNNVQLTNYDYLNNQFSYNNIQEINVPLEVEISTGSNEYTNENTVKIFSETNTNVATEQMAIECEPRPQKGRKRKFPEQNRELKKKKLNTGQQYINNKGKLVEKKEFKGENFDCKCPKKCCEKISVDIRRAEFNKFWTSGSFETRCALLQGYVKQKNKKRNYSNTSKRKYTREYSLYNIPVCKKTLFNTLSISQSRVDVALAKYSAHMPLNDQRGVKSGGKNKIPDSEIEKMKVFFDDLPKYDIKNSTAKFLAPNLNLQIVYDLYNAKHPNSVSQSRFKKYFYNECNLRFKKVSKEGKKNGNKVDIVQQAFTQ
ncbi:unnamed protein product [Brassicogethes aeneus]|uniref:Uncharacterized protein n=1 Tax=Brassicogethes aeneus TaxID=1431903 RepID=A0A9P0BIW3_BRAAE|nr:unnamed protein product [Brassicogethes aeneus]